MNEPNNAQSKELIDWKTVLELKVESLERELCELRERHEKALAELGRLRRTISDSWR